MLGLTGKPYDGYYNADGKPLNRTISMYLIGGELRVSELTMM